MLVNVYAPPDFHAAEMAAIGDALAMANQLAKTEPYYETRIIARQPMPTRARCGLTIMPDSGIADAAPADLLIVSAADAWHGPPEPDEIAWVRRAAGSARRFGATGNGIFLLGAAGLIDGCHVTTHWSCSEELARAYPQARVEADKIFVRDGRLFSGAGGVAAFDLVLALVEEDHGREIALALARDLVMFMKRAGGQEQVSLSLATQTATRDPIQRVQKHISDNPTADLSVAALAAVAAMSPRNLARVFHQETGYRPSDYVEQFRVNLARRMLEESALSPQQVARLCGFPSTEVARRAFAKRLGVTVSGYRASRRAEASPA